MKGLYGQIKLYFDALMDVLFPLDIACHFCKGALDERPGKENPKMQSPKMQSPKIQNFEKSEPRWTDYLCRSCIEALPVITGASCSQCSIPMYDHEKLRSTAGCDIGGSVIICEDCVAKGKESLRNLSFVTYEEDLRKQIYRYKYKDQTYLARVFALMMKELIMNKESIDPYDLILSIPLHKKRQRQRGYNQAHLLAKYLSEATEIPYEARGLIRAKETKKMHTLSRKERKDNLKDAFAFSEEGKEGGKTKVTLRDKIRGKRLLIVDDIYTTGTTAESLGHLLKEENPQSVTIITIARVVL